MMTFKFSWRMTLMACAAATWLGLVPYQAHAGYIATTLGVAGPGNFAIFALGGTNLADTDVTLNGPGQTTGNVGVASAGSIALNSSTPPAILGNLYLGNSANTAGSASPVGPQVQGTIFTNQDAFLGTGTSTGFWTAGTTTSTGAVRDALLAAMTFKNLAPNQTISGNITNPQTLTAGALGPNNTWVVNLTGNINLGNGEFLTLSGNAGTQFILNVGGSITFGGGNGGGILLAGGLTTTDVVINVTSTDSGDNVTSSGGSSPDPNHPGNTLPNAVINGILLDVAGGIGLSPGMVNGEIIGGGNEIRLVSGSQVNGSGGAGNLVGESPEPASAILFGLGVVGFAAFCHAKRRRVCIVS